MKRAAAGFPSIQGHVLFDVGFIETSSVNPMQKLGERLGHRVARDLFVAGEGVNGTPQPFGVGPIDGFDAFVRFHHGHCVVHQ